MRVRVGIFTALMLLLWAPVSMAADAPAAAKRGPQAQEFYRLHGQLNALLGELAGLQVKYRAANEDKRAEIQQQWKELIAKGERWSPSSSRPPRKPMPSRPTPTRKFPPSWPSCSSGKSKPTTTSRPPKSASC